MDREGDRKKERSKETELKICDLSGSPAAARSSLC